MTDNEQKRELPPHLQNVMNPQAIAEGIAKDARDNLDGVEVCHVGPLFVDEDDNCQYLHCYVLLPKDGGKTFAANVITLSHVEEPWLGMVNRNALIVALEFDTINQVVTGLIRSRGLN
jgi:hypothetical protein